MLVRAKEACFIDGSRRRAGAEFEYGGEKLPSCLEAVKANDPKPEPPKPPQPISLSELNMNESKPKSFIDAVAKKK